jgi:hypothetical protein
MNVVCPQTQIQSQERKIHASMLQMYSSCWTTMMRNASSTILLKIQKQSAREEDEEHEPKPETKEMAMTVSELTEGLGNHWSWHQGA